MSTRIPESRETLLTGFGNHFETEALPGTLPVGQNSPQKVNHGLYAEQLSNSAFTAPRHENQRTWLYRIRPSVAHGPYERCAPQEFERWETPPFPTGELSPERRRWNAIPAPVKPTDFFQSLVTVVGNGSPASMHGCSALIYSANTSIPMRHFVNHDAEMLLVPEVGTLTLKTEMGRLDISPKEIAIIPRGVKWRVEFQDAHVRGYLCENFGAPFRLPSLGPIGANGLANPRDFIAPQAAFEDQTGHYELITKFQGQFFRAELGHSPLDVVAWHGNVTPMKYDLSRFNTINTVSFDHPDPSIFTVLTSPTDTPGVANCDFVIFPPRWMVAENTFRPPYYHRNIMSEYMGLIEGVYDAKVDGGFVPGGGSLHNCMAAHGPDAQTFEAASKAELKPERYKNTLAFMFESRWPFAVGGRALQEPFLQKDYWKCWQGLESHFKK
jgi:homogentisate 1,2-dioxygenase